jgi:hypothetical protein
VQKRWNIAKVSFARVATELDCLSCAFLMLYEHGLAGFVVWSVDQILQGLEGQLKSLPDYEEIFVNRSISPSDA